MVASRKDTLAGRNMWDEFIAIRDRQRKETHGAMQVVKEKDLPLETNQMGQMKWYLHPNLKDVVVNPMLVYQQEIPPGSRSGRLKFQGNQVIVILEGQGYSMIDGVKYPWRAGDLVMLPLRVDGVIVQHFNTDPDKTAKFIATEANWLECTTVDRGCGFEQLEDAPEYRQAKQNG